MSMEHEISKCAPLFANVIKEIAKKHMTDRNGIIRGTQRVWGYVNNIHDKEDDELFGTIDVQEYDADGAEGLHEGVYVTALQNNKNGYYIMPSLYSDVLITQDPASLAEYVVLVSHVDMIQLRSHKNVMIGVVETEEFVEGLEDEQGVDVPDLKETGNTSITAYSKDNIIHEVKTADGKVSVKQDINGVIVEAKDSKVVVKSDGSIELEGKKVRVKGSGDIELEGKNVKVKSDDTTVESSNINLKGDVKHNEGSQRMVLGDKLVAHLQQLCQALSTLTVTCTAPGSPSSPPVNFASFTSIASQLQADLSQKSSLD